MKTRFAPSPTGFLHRGHVWSALQVWAGARITGAQVHLRIEDHDQSRCRPAHVDAIRSDLEWLGLHWDSESIQSKRHALYHAAREHLAQEHLLYYCDCTRSRVAKTCSPSADGSGEMIYDGHCRQRHLTRQNGCALRVELPADSGVNWEDLDQGFFQQDPAMQCGDLQLMDRQGQWTYQFAVVVDDMEEGIDLVIRGEDLLHSTARQIMLGRMLGRKHPPAYLHHSLLYDASGKKLSKRDQAASIHDERRQGVAPDQLLGEVLFNAGLLNTRRRIHTEEALTLIKASLPHEKLSALIC